MAPAAETIARHERGTTFGTVGLTGLPATAWMNTARAPVGAFTGTCRKRAAARRSPCSASESGKAFQTDAAFLVHGPKSAVDKSRALILIAYVVPQFRAEWGMC